MKKLLLLLAACAVSLSAAFSQTTQITGTVTSSEDGDPIPGVSVIVLGTTIGVTTDIDGRYSINVPEVSRILQFSFIGMKVQEISIDGRSTIDVVMEPDLMALDEVMVVAYGTVRKEAFTGSASSVNVEKLNEVQTSNITKAIEGLSSGIQVTSGSGQPGTSSSIRIRGIGSLNASTSPLYVVDGFPFSGDINSIATTDVESLTILKDASATALYGSRAANGVIIITTKKGRANDNRVSFKANIGTNVRGIPEYDRVDVPTYYELIWEALYNTRVINAGDDDATARAWASANLIDQLGNYNAYDVPNDQVVGTDGRINQSGNLLWSDSWYDEMHRTGVRQDYTLSTSGGNDKSNYYISGNYLKDEGIVQRSQYDRFTIRLNADTRMKEWVKTGLNISASTSTQNYPASSGSAYVNSFMWSRMIAPIYPVYLYDLSGNLVLDGDGNKQFDYGDSFGRARSYSSNSNPLGVITLDRRLYKDDNASSRGYVEFYFLKDFKLTVNASADYQGSYNLTHQNAAQGDAQSFSGRSTLSSSRRFTFASNQLLNYNKSINEHNLDILAAHESSAYKFNSLSATRTGFPFAGLFELDAAAVLEDAGSYEHNFRMESYFSRINYDFRNRYFLSLSARTDGSSRFAPDYRWGFFWSVGASWRLSQENFMTDLTWVNNLRIKASYGAQGNDNLGSYYAYQGLYALGWNNMGYPGLLASRLPTPELLWEKNNSLNVGLDFTMFERFSMNFEYYIRKSNDLLFAVPLPASTGFSSYDANIGSVENVGFDIEASFLIVKSNIFSWNADINLSHYRNEITELPEGQEQITRGTKQWEVGRSIYDFFLRDFAGVDPATGTSLWYMDVYETDGGGEIVLGEDGKPIVIDKVTTDDYDDATRYYVGTAIPDLQGGLTNSIKIGPVDISLLTTFRIGGQMLDGSYQGLMGGELGDNMHIDMLNRWTPTNTDTDVPLLIFDVDANATSSRFLTPMDFFSFRNLSIGYTFPENLSERIGISDARFFVNVTNLHTFSARKGMDPQQSFGGTTDNSYTPLRTTSFGLNLNF
ncbi:MAG: TonB-dependent receptor [Bacteroidales bacterium]|nr:TonB-dependent receptor [Bacteroidales bacterium]